jgi:ParB-like chromosome segregation protein Spo0J
MAQTVLVADLLFPKRTEYVRGSVKKENVERMRAAITGKDWPFPPIVVRKLDKPEKRKGKEYRLKIVDGVTRTTVALLEKRKDITATIEKMTDVEADITQLRTNLTHGLLVDKKHRDAWVRYLITERKVKPATLAKELHLTERTIFRMKKGTATKEGPRKKMAKRGKASGNGNGASAEREMEWTAADFYSQLHALAKSTKGHAEAITEYGKTNKDKLAPWLDGFMDLLAGS